MNKKSRCTKAFFVVISLALLLQFATPVTAATVTFRVGRVQVAPGSTADVPVEVVGSPGIGPLHLELVYDPAVLSAVEVTRGPLLSNALMESSVAGRGRVVAAIVAADAIKGDGVVIKVRFKAIGTQGQQSALTLDGVKAWERGNGRDVLVNTEAGLATVTGNLTTLWILVAAACLIGLALIGGGILLTLIIRRRSAPRYK
jgi:hypothetical protein